MERRAQLRWAAGTLTVVAIALALDSLGRARRELDARRAPLAVIRRQLAAFRRGDYGAAYRFAAPEIQAQFSLPRFRRMVEQGYPEIVHAHSVSLGAPHVEGDTVIVPVSAAGADGGGAFFVYALRRCRNGWRVAGVERDHTLFSSPAVRQHPSRKHARPQARLGSGAIRT